MIPGKESEEIYFRIGTRYWHLFKSPRLDYATQFELHPWNKTTIIDDKGSYFLKRIRTFDVAIDFDHQKRQPNVFYLCDFLKRRGQKPGRKTLYSFYILKEEDKFFRHVNWVHGNHEN